MINGLIEISLGRLGRKKHVLRHLQCKDELLLTRSAKGKFQNSGEKI